MKFFSEHFPNNKKKWITYLKVFLPIIAGSTFFALNGVVDNFMVGHINQGGAALGAVNTWTGILMGFFMGTAAAGSIAMAQFFYAGNNTLVKEIARLRNLMCLIMSILLALVAWTTPDTLIEIFLKKPSEAGRIADYNVALQNSRDYIKIIAIQWLLISVTFNLGNQFREIGHGKITMYWGMGTLAANVTLNSILMYGLGLGVEGAAWASVAGRIVALVVSITYIIKLNLPIGFKPWSIFQSSSHAWELFWKRWFLFLSIFTVQFFILFRNYFYDAGYRVGSLGPGIGAMSILALSGALMNVFTTTFNAVGAMSSNFVASELGKNNIKQAIENGKELKGFNTTMAIILGSMLALFATIVPYMNFLSENQYDSQGIIIFDSHINLINVRNSLYVITFYYPIWIWFTTSYRNGSQGGKGKLFALGDWLISGPIQLGWLAVIMFGIVPNSPFLSNHFYFAYALFFASDLLKLIWQEITYKKVHWAKSITRGIYLEEQMRSKDQAELIQPD